MRTPFPALQALTPVQVDRLLAAIAASQQLAARQLHVTAGRRAELVAARSIAMLVLRDAAHLSQSRIAHLLGYTQPAGVHHALAAAQDRLAVDRKYRTRYLSALDQAHTTIKTLTQAA
jgi:chromosomal replication initiation ATPase DnaA